jgi:hypothetical protein
VENRISGPENKIDIRKKQMNTQRKDKRIMKGICMNSATSS